MGTPSSIRQAGTDDTESREATPKTPPPELHMHDLPRPGGKKPLTASAHRGWAETGTTTQVATDEKLQPVELEHPANTSGEGADRLVYDSKAHEAELMELNAQAAIPTSSPRRKDPPAPPRMPEKRPSVPAATTTPAPRPVVEAMPPATDPLVRRTSATDGIQPPSSVARLLGRSLRFPSGTRLNPGDKVTVGSRQFEVRREPRFTAKFWWKTAGLAALVIFAVVGISHLFAGTPAGTITGVVIDRTTGQIIPGAAVAVENGAQATTNAAGLFLIDGAKSGQLKLTASAAGYESQSGSAANTPGQGAQLAFALLPSIPVVTPPSEAPARPASTPTATENTEESAPVAYGNVALTTDFEDYMVFVDDVLYGKNAKKLKRMPEGSHKIVLQVEGFEDYSTSVDVKAKATAAITVAKADLVPKVNPVKRAASHYAEGKDFLDKAQWPAAIEAFNQALEYDADNTQALQYRGWAYLKSGSPDKARADFLRAAELDRKAGHYLDAVTCAGYLIDLDPANPEGYSRRAQFYIALTEYGKALADCEQAVKLNKKSFDNQMALAEACFVSGDYRRAAKEFEKARKLTTEPVGVYVRWLLALTRAGQDDQVRKKYKELSSMATPERMQQLRADPEWLPVLQIVDPSLRSEG